MGPSILAVNVRFTQAGTNAFIDAVHPARKDPGPVFPQRAKALGYALLKAHRLHRHGQRVEPKLGLHRRICQAARR